MKTVSEIIDEGSTKFKYGLCWFLNYLDIETPYSYDISYMKLMEKSEREIHDILSKYIDFVLIMPLKERSKDFTLIYSAIINLYGNKQLMITPENCDLVEIISSFMFEQLINIEKSDKKLRETLTRAGNLVIRNFIEAKLCEKKQDVGIRKIMFNYYTEKGKNMKELNNIKW